MKEELISVIITTYKGEKFIIRAINSVLNQVYPNIEIIVVDDNGVGTASQIATQKTLRDYIDHKKIKYLPLDVNSNASVARNIGVKISKGTYVTLLDDDDYFFTECLEKLSEKLINTSKKVGLAYSGFKKKYDNGKTKTFKTAAKNFGNIGYEILCREIRIPTGSFLVKREVWFALGGFDENFKRHQDWEFLTRLTDKYEVAVSNSFSVCKIIISRNSPKDPIEYYNLRLYYLNAMKPLIEHYTLKKQKKILSIHYADIILNYAKNKKYEQILPFFKKHGLLLHTTAQCLNKLIKYANNKMG